MQHLFWNKIACTLFLILSIPVISQAQEIQLNLPDHDEKRFHFGINVGANRSHYSFTHHPLFLQQDSIMAIESINSTGINLSWLVNMRLSEHLSVRTYPLSLVFTEKAFEYSLSKPNPVYNEDSTLIKKIQGITLAFPLQLKFTSDRIANMKVYMMGGGKIEYDMAANKGSKNAETQIKLSPFDYGIEAGIGFHFYFPVFVLTPELKIGYGLNNVHRRDADLKFSNTVDKINSRTVTFSLTVE